MIDTIAFILIGLVMCTGCGILVAIGVSLRTRRHAAARRRTQMPPGRVPYDGRLL